MPLSLRFTYLSGSYHNTCMSDTVYIDFVYVSCRLIYVEVREVRIRYFSNATAIVSFYSSYMGKYQKQTCIILHLQLPCKFWMTVSRDDVQTGISFPHSIVRLKPYPKPLPPRSDHTLHYPRGFDRPQEARQVKNQNIPLLVCLRHGDDFGSI